MAKYSTHSFNQSLIKLPSSRNKPWLFASFKSAFFNPSKMLCEKKLIDCTTATCVFIRAQFLTSIILSLLNNSVKNYCLLNPVYCRIIGHGFQQNCLLISLSTYKSIYKFSRLDFILFLRISAIISQQVKAFALSLIISLLDQVWILLGEN